MKTLYFNKQAVPTRDTHQLWGNWFEPGPQTHAEACTDGSTFRHKSRSGAAYAYLSDGYENEELYLEGKFWKISSKNNYAAEMAALNKCIRSIPVTVPMTIHTDSESCIGAIQKALEGIRHGTLMKNAARPYLVATVRAINKRKQYGADTFIEHVNSHTGNRDKASIGNEAADRAAKWAALDDEETDGEDIPLITENEMDYLVCARHDEWGNDKDEIRPIHGHIRRGVSKALQDRRYREWADIQHRPREGELARENQGKIKEIINEVWKKPTTEKIQALLLVLNQADLSWPRKPCEKCMTGELDTVAHMIDCPSNADIINDLMEKMQ